MKYILENKYLKVEVNDFGARIVRLINKRSGNDLIMGLDDEDYLKYRHLYIGAAVGRNCNLIVGSKITINNKEYKLYANDGNNQLHGGKDGFSFAKWNADLSDTKVIFSNEFADGLDGYPGNMKAEVIYELKDNALSVTFKAVCDKDSIFNPTIHTYFNMASTDFENVMFKTETDTLAHVDEYNQPLDTVFCVKGTPYDFTEFAPIKKQIEALEKGIDTNFVYETMNYKLLASLKTDTDMVKIYSDLPGLEMYTCNDFNGVKGKDGTVYNFRCGVALEPDFFPNSINFRQYLKPLIKANEETEHRIVYEIK